MKPMCFLQERKHQRHSRGLSNATVLQEETFPIPGIDHPRLGHSAEEIPVVLKSLKDPLGVVLGRDCFQSLDVVGTEAL